MSAPPLDLGLDDLLLRQAADAHADLAPCAAYGVASYTPQLECAESQDYCAGPVSAAPPSTSTLNPTVLLLVKPTASVACAIQTESALRVNKMPRRPQRPSLTKTYAARAPTTSVRHKRSRPNVKEIAANNNRATASCSSETSARACTTGPAGRVL